MAYQRRDDNAVWTDEVPEERQEEEEAQPPPEEAQASEERPQVALQHRALVEMAGKGNPKTGGRKKGTRNKASTDLLEAIRDEVGDQDYHPVIQMALVATSEELVERYIKINKGGEHLLVEEPKYSEELKLSAAREVAQYVSPKLKSIEHSAGEEGLGLNLHLNLGPRPKKGNGARS